MGRVEEVVIRQKRGAGRGVTINGFDVPGVVWVNTQTETERTYVLLKLQVDNVRIEDVEDRDAPS